ncbi:hypothetical protein TNCV_517991 [Trichonephila clavipes]|nr:hypothetical protein TNCV_517991 [Trichonephila clavipes]
MSKIKVTNIKSVKTEEIFIVLQRNLAQRRITMSERICPGLLTPRTADSPEYDAIKEVYKTREQNVHPVLWFEKFGLAIHQNDHQARRRFVEWAQNEIVVVPDFPKRILFSDEAHFWLNGYVNKQNCRIWSEANPQVYVETPLHREKLTVWCALWAGGILL